MNEDLAAPGGQVPSASSKGDAAGSEGGEHVVEPPKSTQVWAWLPAHVDRYFAVYLIGVLLLTAVAVVVKEHFRERAFSTRCIAAGGVPRLVNDRVCLRPNSIIEVPQ